ncbi:hypothetical protein KM043_014310 [Ampulex compressa]|nr:hypothetical protein KM043_014310 [Ampulex compressa]
MKQKEDDAVQSLLEQDAVEMFDEERDKIRALAKENLLAVQTENRQQYNKRCKEARTYKVGDIVFIRKPQFGSTLKILPKYVGPYKVTRVIGNHRYEVDRIGEGEGLKSTTTAADYMKIYEPEDQLVSSGTEDMQDGRM